MSKLTEAAREQYVALVLLAALGFALLGSVLPHHPNPQPQAKWLPKKSASSRAANACKH